MEVVLAVLGDVAAPYLDAYQKHGIRMALGRGVVEVGSRPSALKPVRYEGGEIRLYPCDFEKWIGSADLRVLSINISDAALTAACHANRGQIELRRHADITDHRVVALVSAVKAEMAASFPSGRLFLDSVEQALALSLVDGYAVRRPSPGIYRGGLAPARLRTITEFVQAKIDEDLTLADMADSVNLSVAHFSQMFRRSTGQSPHQFVLHSRVERAKEILRAADSRVLDVAVACGFKTQQHFARVFRKMCGVSPTDYRQAFLR